MGTGQQSVAINMAGGVIGELAFDGPRRAQPGAIMSAGPNTIGFAFTQVAGQDGQCNVGGAGAFYGILANPKVYPLFGTGSPPLGPTLNLPQYAEGEFITNCTGMFVSLPAACNVGDLVDYTSATGALATRLGVQPSSGAQRVALVAATGVATVSLTPAGAPPIGLGSLLTTADGQSLRVVALGTGTGGNGTYTTTGATADHAAEAFSYTSVPASGNVNIPGWQVVRDNLTTAGVGIIGTVP